ncbi:MAG: hypothetical protein ACE5HT_02770 [Gemmatimonadales bacterium]
MPSSAYPLPTQTVGVTGEKSSKDIRSVVSADCTDWFRFGDGCLSLRCDDPSFRKRFHDLYRESLVSQSEPGLPVVGCRVQLDQPLGKIQISFDDPEALDAVAFALSALADFGFRKIECERTGWRAIRSSTTPGTIRFCDHQIVADPESPWQSVAGSLAIHRVLRLQRNTFFFHAATIGVGNRGLILMGPKESGKTTMSLALADRGHAFFGDEFAVVRLNTLELLPFRRRISVRPGPAAVRVSHTLESGEYQRDELSDGTVRTRAHADELFPGDPPKPLPATTLVFLRGKTASPHLERFTPGAQHLRYLTPYESLTWGANSASVVVKLLRLMGRLKCYFLDLGPVADTTKLLEDLMMET